MCECDGMRLMRLVSDTNNDPEKERMFCEGPPVSSEQRTNTSHFATSPTSITTATICVISGAQEEQSLHNEYVELTCNGSSC